MTVPLFDVSADPTTVVELVMAGRYARLDATTDEAGRDVVVLSADFAAARLDLPDGHAAEIHRMVRSGRLAVGAPVTARVAGAAHAAHLIIGPVDPGGGS